MGPTSAVGKKDSRRREPVATQVRRPPDPYRVESLFGRHPEASPQRATAAVPGPVSTDEDIGHVHRRWRRGVASDQIGDKVGQTIYRSRALVPAVAGEGPLAPIEDDDLALGLFGPDEAGLNSYRPSCLNLLIGDLVQASEERIRQHIAGPRERMLDEHEHVELRCCARRFHAELASPRRAGRVRHSLSHRVASAELSGSTNTTPSSTLRAYCSSWQPGFEMPLPVVASKDHMWLAQVMTVPSKPPKRQWELLMRTDPVHGPERSRGVPEHKHFPAVDEESRELALHRRRSRRTPA